MAIFFPIINLILSVFVLRNWNWWRKFVFFSQPFNNINNNKNEHFQFSSFFLSPTWSQICSGFWNEKKLSKTVRKKKIGKFLWGKKIYSPFCSPFGSVSKIQSKRKIVWNSQWMNGGGERNNNKNWFNFDVTILLLLLLLFI